MKNRGKVTYLEWLLHKYIRMGTNRLTASDRLVIL